MTTRHACAAATFALGTFLVAVGFILAAVLRDPVFSEGDRFVLWSCYGFLVLVAVGGSAHAWGRR